MEIDVGSAAIDRTSHTTSRFTNIDKANPANADGIITTVEIWMYTSSSEVFVGSFYLTGANQLKCRDSVSLGSVSSGSKQVISGLNLEIKEGDFIGVYCQAGSVDQSVVGGVGWWYKYGNYIDPGDEAVYSYSAGYPISVYGKGATVAVGRSFGSIF